jgi:hypothetical protein
MDAIFNFGLRFAQASESKVRMADRWLTRETVERIATGVRLIRYWLSSNESDAENQNEKNSYEQKT